MLKIGLTGSIGSGKTMVCEHFKQLGIPIFNSDDAARALETLPQIQTSFKEVLGSDIYVNGVLDRVKMRSIVFTDKEKLTKINNVVIPYLKKDFEHFYKINSVLTKHPYCIFESAILLETGNKDAFDKIITVTSDMDRRIERVMKRDKITEQEVMNKINVQMSDLQKESHADFVIKNNGEDLTIQVKTIHTELKRIENIRHKIHYPEINGIYKHYKGGKYQVITIATHSETNEAMVVYKSLHFGSYHVRPLSMWFDEVGALNEPQEYKTYRFELIQ